MKRSVLAIGFISLVTILSAQGPDDRPYRDHFDPASCTFLSSGMAKYFILEPGYHQLFRGREGKDSVTLVITVLAETRKVGAVETRIVEERETAGGKLREVSRNYLALCKETGDIWYFGEEVDEYRNGRVTGHEGSWLAEGTNRPGLMVPGKPSKGDRYFQELAPKTAMDRAEVISIADTLTVPAGRFDRVLKTRETSPLEAGDVSIKYYAPGIGLIRDGSLELVEYGYPHQEEGHGH